MKTKQFNKLALLEKMCELPGVCEDRHLSPSRMPRRLIVVALASIAFLAAVYMGLYELQLIDTIWDPVFGEGTKLVLTSNVSHQLTRWFGIPDAVLGAMAYLADIVFALSGSSRRWQDRPWLVFLFALNVIPLGLTSATLVALQGTLVGSWCFLCLCTACISLSLVLLAYEEVSATVRYLFYVKKRSGIHVAWKTFWGKASESAYQVAQSLEE